MVATLDIIYVVLEYFLVFSFLGWCVEVAYQAVKKGIVVNRGFLNGPVCPIYGFGVLAVFFMLQMAGEGDFQDQNALVVFLFGVALSTAVELFGGWILDKAFHARWWDYSNNPFNFHGYICLEFSIIWGIAILIVVRVIYPMLNNVLSYIPEKVGWVLIVIFCTLYLADFILSVSIMIGLNKRMAELDEMQKKMRVVSNKLSTSIGEHALETAQKMDEAKVQASLARTEIINQASAARTELMDQAAATKSELMDQAAAAKSGVIDQTEALRNEYESAKQEFDKRWNELAARLEKSRNFGTGRLLRAFPEMKHRDHAELLESIRKNLSDRLNG